MSEAEERAIYAAGKAAYSAGLTARHNPYRLGTDKFHVWCSGYWAMNSIGYDDRDQA